MRAFFSDLKQFVLPFSLPKAGSPCCFAALLNNVFPLVRFPLLIYLLLSRLDLSLMTLYVPFDPKFVVLLYRLSTYDLSLLVALVERFDLMLIVPFCLIIDYLGPLNLYAFQY